MDVLHEMACTVGLRLTRDEAHSRFRGVRMADIAAWIGSQVADKPDEFETEFTRRYRATITQRFRENLSPMPGAMNCSAIWKFP